MVLHACGGMPWMAGNVHHAAFVAGGLSWTKEHSPGCKGPVWSVCCAVRTFVATAGDHVVVVASRNTTTIA
jgi:hypothetical protein